MPDAIPQELKVSLYRIAQEAVQNAIKHSGAGEMLLSLTGKGDSLVLVVGDHGAGFDVDAAMQRGLGLVSMAERLEPFGGQPAGSSPRAAPARGSKRPYPAGNSPGRDSGNGLIVGLRRPQSRQPRRHEGQARRDIAIAVSSSSPAECLIT